MDIAWFPNNIAQNGHAVMTNMLQGFKDQGHKIIENTLSADAAMIWSQLWAGRMRGNREIYQQYRTQNRPVMIIDAGCIQRGHTWRIRTDQHDVIAGSGHNDARRTQLGLAIDPWRHQRGSDVLIALQRTDSNQWQHMPDVDTWLGSMIKQIKQHTDRTIRIRPHPRHRISYAAADVVLEQPQHVTGTYDSYDFYASLDRAWCVINWNSSPGVIAALRGVPVFVGGTSLAAPVANQDFSQIEHPVMPDRTQWANDVAWTEWTVSEMQHGVPQRYLLDLIRDQ